MSLSESTQSEDSTGTDSRKRYRWWHWIVGALLVILVASALIFVLWASNTPDPGPRAQAALESTETVTVTNDDGYTFAPVDGADVGFIFYQGARVDPASYAPTLHALADDGYLVVAPDLRLNMAILEPNAADGVIDDYPDIKRWVIGGHSLGGAMAAKYTNDHRDEIDGLVLWAAYPPGGTNLSDYMGPVTSISGTRDGLATPSDIADSRSRLPADTDFVVIEGGNHAQFGDYGHQSGDDSATISAAEQTELITEATDELLTEVAAE